MSESHKKTHNKADPDEENLSDSLLGVLRSSRSTRNMEEQRLEKMLQEMMDEKVKQLVAETNIPQLIQQHALKGQNSFQVDIESYCVQWQLAVSTEVYNITLWRSLDEFFHSLLNILNNEEMTAYVSSKCMRQDTGRDRCERGMSGRLQDGKFLWARCPGHSDGRGKPAGDYRLNITWN